LRADERVEEERNAKNQKNSGIGQFVKTVATHGLVVEFATEKADKLITWITRHFNANNVKYELNVPREIINVCGSDMYILQGEIKKLTEVYDEKPLTANDVRKYCCANNAYKYFDIADALNRRDLLKATKILNTLNLTREEISMAVGVIVKNFSDMLLVKTAMDSGVAFDSIAKETKIQPWLVQKMARSVSQTDIRFINHALSSFASADLKLKSFCGNPFRILESTFYRICTYGRKA
jgi:DNA polymerase-3 subunit delta